MTLTYAKVQTEAQAIADLSNRMAVLLEDAKKVVQHQSDLAINWTTPAAAYFTLDSNGNMSGFTFAPADVSNAVNALQQFINLMTNILPTKGNYSGVINLLAQPAG